MPDFVTGHIGEGILSNSNQRRTTIKVTPKDVPQSIVMRMENQGAWFIQETVASKQSLLRPQLIFAHDQRLIKRYAFPHVAANGRADVRKENIPNPQRSLFRTNSNLAGVRVSAIEKYSFDFVGPWLWKLPSEDAGKALLN